MAANKSRSKGHNAEREFAQIFRDLGYPYCKTSRQASRLLDDAGIDLAFIPFNIQIKCGYPNLNEMETILYTRRRIEELFPPNAPERTRPVFVIHKLNVGRGKKRTKFDTLVYMTLEDATVMMDFKVYDIHKIKEGQKRGWSFSSELKGIDYLLYKRNKKDTKFVYVTTFENFKNKVQEKNIQEWQNK